MSVETDQVDAAKPVRATVGQLASYSSGSLGMGVWVTVPGLLLLYFMTHTLGVSPLLAGLTLLLPKVIDAVVHPFLGSLSDRQARAHGHRRRMMWWGLGLAIAMTAMFSVPPALEGAGAAVWIGAWYIVGNLLFACFQVPYLTTPSDLKISYHERTRVFMFRMMFLTVGLLGAGVAAPALVKSGERGDYAQMAIILSVAMVVTGVIGILGVRRLTEHTGVVRPDARDHSFAEDFKVAVRDRDFRALVLSYLFTGTVTHLFLAAVPFYTQYVFGSSGLTSLFMGAFLAPAVVAGPMWLAVSRRIGKQRGRAPALATHLHCGVARTHRWRPVRGGDHGYRCGHAGHVICGVAALCVLDGAGCGGGRREAGNLPSGCLHGGVDRHGGDRNRHRPLRLLGRAGDRRFRLDNGRG